MIGQIAVAHLHPLPTLDIRILGMIENPSPYMKSLTSKPTHPNEPHRVAFRDEEWERFRLVDIFFVCFGLLGCWAAGLLYLYGYSRMLEEVLSHDIESLSSMYFETRDVYTRAKVFA